MSARREEKRFLLLENVQAHGTEVVVALEGDREVAFLGAAGAGFHLTA